MFCGAGGGDGKGKWGRFHLLLHTGVDQLEKAGGSDLVTYLLGGGEEGVRGGRENVPEEGEM